MQHHPAVKLVYTTTAERDAEHGAVDATGVQYGLRLRQLERLAEYIDAPLTPREPWEALDCLEDEGDNSVTVLMKFEYQCLWLCEINKPRLVSGKHSGK